MVCCCIVVFYLCSKTLVVDVKRPLCTSEVDVVDIWNEKEFEVSRECQVIRIEEVDCSRTLTIGIESSR